MKKKAIILPTTILAALALVSVVTVKSVRADEKGGYFLIIQRLVERFNLDSNEVEQVFEEVRQERGQQMQANFETRLDELVSEGKISQEQKEAALAKKEEMQANREEFENLSAEERRVRMEAHRQEMETWAEENGIDLELMPMLGGGGPRRGGFGPGFDN